MIASAQAELTSRMTGDGDCIGTRAIPEPP